MNKRSLSTYFRRFKIGTRINLSLLILTIIPTCFLFFISQHYITNYINESSVNHININQTSIERNIKMLFKQVDMFTLKILHEKQIFNLFKNSTLSTQEKYEKLDKIIDDLMPKPNIISGIGILFNDGTMYQYRKNPELVLPNNLLTPNTKPAIPQYVETYSHTHNEYYTVQLKKCIEFNTGYNLGYLCLFIDKETILNAYKATISPEYTSFIINNDNQIISSDNLSLIGEKLYLAPCSYSNSEDNLIAHMSFDNDKYVFSKSKINIQNIPNLEWYVVSFISTASFEKSIKSMHNYVIFGLIIIVIFSIIASFWLSKKIIYRINMLKKNMTLFGQGKLISDYTYEPIKDEVWFLERCFYELTIQIDNLIEKNRESEKKQREYELQALQAQINPHFIYNTLDSIKWTAKMKNQPQIERTAYLLATFFRISLHKGDKYITVSEEIRHVKSYIAIEQIRLGNQFDVEFNIANDIADKKMIKIILQPLVENAIKHAVVPSKQKIKIKITGFCDNEHIYFEVSDTGPGFDTSLLEESTSKTGYGIKNVRERIKLEYGNDCGLSYYSVKNKITRAEVVIKDVPPGLI